MLNVPLFCFFLISSLSILNVAFRSICVHISGPVPRKPSSDYFARNHENEKTSSFCGGGGGGGGGGAAGGNFGLGCNFMFASCLM